MRFFLPKLPLLLAVTSFLLLILFLFPKDVAAYVTCDAGAGYTCLPQGTTDVYNCQPAPPPDGYTGSWGVKDDIGVCVNAAGDQQPGTCLVASYAWCCPPTSCTLSGPNIGSCGKDCSSDQDCTSGWCNYGNCSNLCDTYAGECKTCSNPCTSTPTCSNFTAQKVSGGGQSAVGVPVNQTPQNANILNVNQGDLVEFNASNVQVPNNCNLAIKRWDYYKDNALFASESFDGTVSDSTGMFCTDNSGGSGSLYYPGYRLPNGQDWRASSAQGNWGGGDCLWSRTYCDSSQAGRYDCSTWEPGAQCAPADKTGGKGIPCPAKTGNTETVHTQSVGDGWSTTNSARAYGGDGIVRYKFDGLSSGYTDITVNESGDSCKIRVSVSQTVGGKVTNCSTGAGLSGVKVLVYNNQNNPILTTDSGGNWSTNAIQPTDAFSVWPQCVSGLINPYGVPPTNYRCDDYNLAPSAIGPKVVPQTALHKYWPGTATFPKIGDYWDQAYYGTPPGGSLAYNFCYTPSVGSCTVTLSPSSMTLSQGGTGQMSANVTVQGGTVSKVDFSSDDGTVASVSPSSDTASPYLTTVTGVDMGTAHIGAKVYLAGSAAMACETNGPAAGGGGGGGGCQTNCDSPIIVSSAPGWFQTHGGDVHTAGDVGSLIPDTATNMNFSMDLDLFPGVVSYAGTSANFDQGSVSSTGWLANTGFSLAKSSYDYYYSKLGEPTTENFDGSKPSASGTYFANGDRVVNSNWSVASGEKIVVLVNGDLGIKGTITVASGGFLSFIVKGDVFVDGNLENGSSPVMEGIYLVDGTMTTNCGGIEIGQPSISCGSTVASKKRFIGAGMFIAKNGYVLNRDLGDSGQVKNSTTPSELFIFRPDLVINTPVSLQISGMSWLEVAP